jgi:peptidoglycan/LPS O-acetylase OafA/YrhL
VTGDEGMSGGGESGGQAPTPMANLTTTEQLMALGALLLIVVSDFIGSVITDEYSITRFNWMIAVGVIAAIWAVKMRNMTLPISYKSVLVFLGYSGLVLGIRDFIADIESTNYLGSDNIIYALAAYAGGLLLAYGAYQTSRSN